MISQTFMLISLTLFSGTVYISDVVLTVDN